MNNLESEIPRRTNCFFYLKTGPETGSNNYQKSLFRVKKKFNLFSESINSLDHEHKYL